MPAEVSFDHLISLKDEISSMKEVVIKSDAKMDVFIATQVAHEKKIGTLESRVDKAEDDIADLRAQRSSDFRVIGVLGFVAGGIITVLQWVGWSAIKGFIKL
jgi:translation initiation factor 2B subunit (eIF-2B alpha/beta/delta family)